jgi:pimeloyl-ACP methyl ester carboxylesterase
MIGYETLGSGPRTVIVLNDWICDTSTWQDTHAYLDGTQFRWVFADLRGYGHSKALRGDYTVTEAAADVVALADALDCPRFAIVGHSMSTLIALHLAQQRPDRVDRAVVLSPPPPTGFGADEARLAEMRALARGDEATQLQWMRLRLGDRFSAGWVRHKTQRWRASSDPEAVAGYVAMFARDGLPDPTAPIRGPLLAVTGEQDIEPMRQAAVTNSLAPLCEGLIVAPIADSGHYPMQETPPLLVAIVERFLAGH